MRLRILIPLLLLLSSSPFAADSQQEEPLPPGIRIIRIHKLATYSPEHPTAAYKKEKHDLESVYHKWSKTFHMDDWNVEVSPVPLAFLKEYCPPDLNDPTALTCAAASDWSPWTHRGVMFVLQRSDYTADMKKYLRQQHVSIWSDQRNSVVHEILHNVIEHANEEFAVRTLTGLINP
jgi:hypothetical protein